jgi:cytochrome c biogenesis DsbD-like protein
MPNGFVIILLGFLPFNSPRFTDSIVRVTVPEVRVRAGETGVINLHITVKKDYHIQAHVVYDEFLVPTTIELPDGEVISTTGIKFPPGKKFRLEGATDNLYVYDEDFTIVISFKTNKKVKQERYSLHGKLHYQACNLQMCLRPTSTDFTIPLTIQ